MADLHSIDNIISVLQKCRKNKNLVYAKHLHAHICKHGLESHRAVGNYIVPMFVDCGSVPDAQQVFNSLVHRNVHSWTSLMVGYIECGQLQHALDMYQNMQQESIRPSSCTLLTLLKACVRLKDVERGRQIHAEITRKGFQNDVFIGSALIDMYAKCGSLSEAREAFDKLPVRNVVTWNALITGYAEHGPAQRALKYFEQMQLEGISPDAVTFVCALKACGSIGEVDKGREIQTEIAQRGFKMDVFVSNTLIDMYARCGSLIEAQEFFDSLPLRNVVSWNALLAGYAEHGPCQQVLKCFEQMQVEGIFPNSVTFLCILKACGNIGAIDKGREMHAYVAQERLEREDFVASTLVDMYAKCGSIAEARQVFDKLPCQNLVSWNALIAGYAEHGSGQEALACFERMQGEGVSPNAVTFVGVLKACRSMGAIDKGREMHAHIARRGFERDVFVGSVLVDMYIKGGSLTEAREVFEKLPVRNVVSWTALIAGYAEHGPCLEALKCFEQMQVEGVSPNAITFVCLLKACAGVGAIDKGREMHADLAQKGFERDAFVGCTLIDMYAKCGSLLEAQEVFDNLLVRDTVSWNAMIKGYGLNHEGEMAVQCFEEMQKEGVKPDDITFTCLLTACSRAKLVLKGQDFFNMMREEYHIVPTMDHYTCMIDLLAKSGHLIEAEKFLETMPCLPLWTALLSGCKTYGESELGLRCFQQVVQMDPEDAAPYVLMSKIYASAGRWEDACKIEELRKHVGAKKKPATALIEVNKKVHEFVVGNNESKDISTLLEYLGLRMKEEGHVPNVNLVLRPISDEGKEAELCEHVEYQP